MAYRFLAGLLIFMCCAAPDASGQPPAEPIKLPRVPATEPIAVGSTFRVLDGFQMQLLAAEPLVTDPVALEYDENGRAYVAEMRDYPYTDTKFDVAQADQQSPPLGRIRLLVDHDGDGRFDASTIFAEELSWPTGLALHEGGVFVCATPDLWYLKDTDGDGRADVRRKVFSGFRKFNVQAVINNLRRGLDNRIYGAGSSNGGLIARPDHPAAKPTALARADFSFDPRDESFEVISGSARFGNTFNDWGDRFICNIRNPVQHVVLPARYLARNPYASAPTALRDVAAAGDTLPVYRASPPEPWRLMNAARLAADPNSRSPRSEQVAVGYVTSAAGATIYRGGAYPREYYGQVFLGEVSGNLVHRQRVQSEGVTFTSRRIDDQKEFVASTDNWFRPVNFVNAPDGTLHVLDMYRETIEHPWSIPDDIKAALDLTSGRDRGRIYRLAPSGFQPPAPPKLGQARTMELVSLLKHPNSWQRETAHRLLFERQDKSAVAPLAALLGESDDPRARLHALWSLHGLEDLSTELLLIALADESPHVRQHAVLLAESRLASEPMVLDRVLALAEDSDIRVRFQAAFTLGETDEPRADAALLAIVRRDPDDPWMSAAVLSSARDRAPALLAALLSDSSFAARDSGRALVRQLAVTAAATDNAPQSLALLKDWDASPAARRSARFVALGLAEGLRQTRRSLAELQSHEVFVALLADAAGAALADSEPLAARTEAIALVAQAEFARARSTLERLLAARQPQAVQMAAARAIGGYRDPQVADMLLGPWRSFTPAVQIEVIEALLTRADRVAALLDAVERGAVAPSQISPVRRALLMTRGDEPLRARATKLFSAASSADRQRVIEPYRAALAAPGDAAVGRKIFERECLACHKLDERGHDVGPNLSTIRHRTPEEIVTHVLDPNREVAPNFMQYAILLDDGRLATGIIAEETATGITLRRAENVQENIQRANIEEMSALGSSLMPEGLEKKITPREMADLVAMLLATRAPAATP